MYWVFLVCATVGSTVMVVQLLLTVLGIGGDHMDFDAHADGDFDGVGHGSDWLFGALSFRTIFAALAFFGLSGLASWSAGHTIGTQLTVGTVAGMAALYGVYSLLRLLHSFSHDGGFRIESALGTTGAVYIPIPGSGAGAGKIQVEAQGRLVELKAVTNEQEKLRTGAKVVVVDVVAHDTVRVERETHTAS